MNPFLRGERRGGRGAGQRDGGGKRWEAMGSQPGNRGRGSRKAKAGGVGTGMFWLELPIGFH